MGRYVWQRFDIISEPVYVDNPAIYIRLETSANTLPILDANFNVSDVDEYLSFFDGFKWSHGSGGNSHYSFHITSYGSLALDMGGNQYFGVITGLVKNSDYPRTGTFTTSGNVMGLGGEAGFAKSGRALLKDWRLTPKDFIVSNTEDAFPKDGPKRNYYYRSFGVIDNAQTLSLAPELFDTVKDISIEELRQEVKSNADTETTGTGNPA